MRLVALVATLVAFAACTHHKPIDDPKDDTPLHARVALRCETTRENTKRPEGAVEGHRIKGGPAVPLSDATLVRLRERHYSRVTVHSVVCVDPRGDVSCIDFGGITRPREIAQTIVDAVQEWKYEPYSVHGEPVEACFQLNFNYKIQ